MREIKFRFWDQWNQVYCYSAAQESLSKFFELYEKTKEGENNPQLEQYTGLEDRNCQEIYEGDICKDYDGKIYPVEVHPGYISCGGIMGCDELCQEDIALEIMGNIHENPELLETDKQL